VETPRFCGCLRETRRSSRLVLQDCRRLNATSEERLINRCFECLALASLVWRIVGVSLREGTKFFRLFSARGVSLWPIFPDSLPEHRLGGKKMRRALCTVCRHIYSMDMYTRSAAWHLKAHSWTRMSLRARTSSLFIQHGKSVRGAPNGAGSCKLRNYVAPGGSGSIIYVEWGFVCSAKETL